jgi:DNA-binding response OmpR family regulator
LGALMHIAREVTSSLDEARAVVVLCAEEELRDVITYWFTSLSICAYPTTDGYEAARILKTKPVGLLITDRVLPPWPGLDTFRQLRSANPRLRIAFVDDGSRTGVIIARITGTTVVLTRPLIRRQVIEALGWPELVP